MPLIVDTGALELLRRGDRRVESLVLRFYPPLLCPHITGAFLFGQEHAGVTPARLLQIRAFLADFETVSSTATTAAIYAHLRADATARGLTLPDPDYWIAAHAIEQRCDLISTDRHFRHFPEFRLHYVSPSRS